MIEDYAQAGHYDGKNGSGQACHSYLGLPCILFIDVQLMTYGL